MHADPQLNPAIALRGVKKHFGTIPAVDGVDLEIRRGEVFGLIGHNGAGKSTLFKLMLGLLEASAGEIRVGGQLVGGKGFREQRRQIGYLPENVVLWDNLSGIETLRFFAKLKGVDCAECAPTLERVGLAAATGRAVREYSKGMRQRLGFAQALLGRPQVLLLDEPTSGLDPQGIRHFYDTLSGLRDQGVTMVLSSHILSELQTRVDRLAVLSSGRVKAQGTVQSLRETHDLPLTLTLSIAQTDFARVRQVLAGMPQAVWGPAGLDCRTSAQGLHLRCPRASKMAVLQALAPLGHSLLDLQITEASLEDLFFAAGSSEVR